MVDPATRIQKALVRKPVDDIYYVMGKVNEGTFGVVYKAVRQEDKVRLEQNREANKNNQFEPNKITYLAIKKPKNSKEGEGFNKDAVREIALLRELSKHLNIVTLREVVLCPEGNAQVRGLYLVFDWADYELCEILRTHRERDPRQPPSERMVKSIMWQILNGINYMHSNWVVHRDLKPSNILIMGRGSEFGRVKIADFGMARLFQQPLRSLHIDGVVVTVWYRAPELILNAKHYSKAIDMWAIGCILGELLTNNPLFQGKEDKSHRAFQEDQLKKIIRVVGVPTVADWSGFAELSEWKTVEKWAQDRAFHQEIGLDKKDPFWSILPLRTNPHAADLLRCFFNYDPSKRITALDALRHPYFTKSQPFPLENVFLNERGQADVNLYGARQLHPINMSGQAMPANNRPTGGPGPGSGQASMGGGGQMGMQAGMKRTAQGPPPGHDGRGNKSGRPGGM
uniref:Cyclin-dependent kinase 8 n=1 Tax=Cryptomonas curvata TaxID=233186 RepID=A0A7S0QLZ4_9CRYP|mmetsp:Transcript_35048/g.73434  ORF Transcript_35048/g.73434 Transcript_35048/m.73434 type:complete len:455 (+) Transcript_35048:63-1427(+)